MFQNSSFLINHMQRRHPEVPIEKHVIETINRPERSSSGGKYIHILKLIYIIKKLKNKVNQK